MRGAAVALGMLLSALGSVFALPTAAQASWGRSAIAEIQSPGGIGIRLVDVPVDELNNPRALAYIIDALPPGTTIRRRVEVSNSTSRTQHVTVYAGGSAIVDDRFVPAAPDELSSWMQVAPGSLTLAPGSKRMVMVTIAVPRGATNGERYATVWAQIKLPTSATQRIAEVEQVGVRVYLDVSHGAPSSDFRIGKVTGAPGPGGSTIISADVTNTGQRAVDISGTATLASADGQIHAGPYKQDNAVTLPLGGSGATRFTVRQALPPGRWNAVVTLRSGTTVHTVSGTIAVGKASTLKPASSGGSTWVVAVVAVAAGLAVVGGGAVVVRRRRGEEVLDA